MLGTSSDVGDEIASRDAISSRRGIVTAKIWKWEFAANSRLFNKPAIPRALRRNWALACDYLGPEAKTRAQDFHTKRCRGGHAEARRKGHRALGKRAESRVVGLQALSRQEEVMPRSLRSDLRRQKRNQNPAKDLSRHRRGDSRRDTPSQVFCGGNNAQDAAKREEGELICILRKHSSRSTTAAAAH
jgi:hypothetical protein